MRTLSARRWAFAMAALGLLASALTVRAAEDLKGKWIFSVVQVVPTDLMLFDVKDQDGKLGAEVVESRLGQKPTVSSITQEDDKLVLKMALAGNEATFTQGSASDDMIRGIFSINGQDIPATLTKTTDAKLPMPDAALQEKMRPVITALQTRDPKERTKKIEALIKENGDAIKSLSLYTFLFASAGDSGLSEKALRQYYEEWVEASKAFGAPMVASTQSTAIKALSGKKAYAGLTFELAQNAEKSLPESATTETRAALAGALALSAREVGKADIAAEAEAKSAKLEGQLDEEYHQKVPPFKPEASVVRKDKTATRVVLFELFTGAQCPPCVAADVAFDALNKTYTPDEVITLQYHLHIPGPDPLTSPDSVARSNYYGDDLQGTPTTFFNGKSLAGGGGGMPNAKAKYDEYRELIDTLLEAKKKADIDLKADLKGDVITINATAKVTGAPKGDDGDKPKDENHEKSPTLKLRFALIEESIRYVGGNRLRFHHHVVRALPGGPEGKDLKDGEGKADVTVNLAELRQSLETYLSDFAKQGAEFPNPMPTINLENLSVVAFVQDDSDHSILHAVLVPLGNKAKDAK